VCDPAPRAAIASVASVATHGPGLGSPMSLAIGALNVEPRRVVTGGKANAWLEVTFDRPMAAGVQVVSTEPAISGVAATGDGTAVVKVTLPTWVADHTCYRFRLAGSTAVDGSTAGPDANFCVCYLEGDVNRTSPVNTGDRQLVTSIANWNRTVPGTAADPQTDITRDGIVNTGDLQAVTSIANWNVTPSACP